MTAACPDLALLIELVRDLDQIFSTPEVQGRLAGLGMTQEEAEKKMPATFTVASARILVQAILWLVQQQQGAGAPSSSPTTTSETTGRGSSSAPRGSGRRGRGTAH